MINFKNKLFLLVFVGLIIPQVSFAVEGTCSWHGGINCKAGFDIDGSVICNDGWRDSSELFYSAIQCENIQHSCTDKEFDSLLDKYSIKEQQDEIGRLIDKQKEAYDDKYDSTLSSEERDQASSDFYELSSQLFSLQNNLDSDVAKSFRECDVLGEKAFKQLQIEALAQEDEYQNQLRLQRQQVLDAQAALIKEIQTKAVTPIAPTPTTNTPPTLKTSIEKPQQKAITSSQLVSTTTAEAFTDTVSTTTKITEVQQAPPLPSQKGVLTRFWGWIQGWFR